MVPIEIAILGAALIGCVVYVVMKIRQDSLDLQWSEREDEFMKKALIAQKEFIRSIKEVSGLNHP